MPEPIERQWYRQRFDFYRRGVLLDASGLTERFWLAPAVHHPWDSIERVDHGPGGAVIVARHGEMRVGPGLRQWRDLVDRVSASIGQREVAPGPIGTVPPETVAAWLGLAPGETLVCGPYWLARPEVWRTRKRSMHLAFGLCLLVVLPLMCFGRAPAAALIMPGWIAWMAFGLPWLIELTTPLITASATGLTIRAGRSRRYVRWSDVDSMADDPLHKGWRVGTSGGADFILMYDTLNYDRLLAVIRQVIAARNEGKLLPQDGPVPDGAISQVRLTGDEGAERGVSRVSEQPGS